jgi:hypothetical protein
MKKQSTFKEKLVFLEAVFGKREAVADLLGYSLRRYNALRNGEAEPRPAVVLAVDRLILAVQDELKKRMDLSG